MIQKHLPKFVYLEAPIGEDPDKRDYIVSNARIAATGFKPEWGLDRGIKELIKGYHHPAEYDLLERLIHDGSTTTRMEQIA